MRGRAAMQQREPVLRGSAGHAAAGCGVTLSAGLAAAACPLPPPLNSPRAPPCLAGGWERRLLHDFGAPVWRVSWSVSGNILSVSDANSRVTLCKEGADGQWAQLTQ